MKRFGYIDPIVLTEDYTVADGEHRLKVYEETGQKEVPAIILPFDDAERRLFRQAANKIHGSHDPFKDSLEFKRLAEAERVNELAILAMTSRDAIMKQIAKYDPSASFTPDFLPGSLADRFGVPPLSVLDGRSKGWTARRKLWRKLGLEDLWHKNRFYSAIDWSKEHGKPVSFKSEASAFDPVLCELMLKWFCPANGRVLDPFAGTAVLGIVASMLKRQYTGIDIDKEQLAKNNEIYDTVSRKTKLDPMPVWLEGDSQKILQDPGLGQFDLLFTSPPFLDLHSYSQDPRDISRLKRDKFLTELGTIFEHALARMKAHRFAIVHVREPRTKSGHLYPLTNQIISIFEAQGAFYYNHLVQLMPIGITGLRQSRFFTKSRLVAFVHQELLVFYKGDRTKIPPLPSTDRLDLPMEAILEL